MAKKKFYAVAVGVNPGIYTSWPEAESQVKGFAGAKYKGFATKKEAEDWLVNPTSNATVPKKKKHNAGSGCEIAKDGVTVFTDGGAINNPGPGGWGTIIVEEGQERELSGGYKLTTNNRMELMACIMGLDDLKAKDEKVTLYSDSSYVVNGIEKGWAKSWRRNGWLKSDKNPAKNSDLWELLLDLCQNLDIKFIWVKGHAGHHYNERCDKLAVQSARSGDYIVDSVFEEEQNL